MAHLKIMLTTVKDANSSFLLSHIDKKCYVSGSGGSSLSDSSLLKEGVLFTGNTKKRPFFNIMKEWVIKERNKKVGWLVGWLDFKASQLLGYFKLETIS